IRRRWKGNLVVKGVLAAEDARIAKEKGADGIIVSNHGGRQLDGTIAPLDVLPEVVDAAGDMTVMFDSGVRRGGDVLKALALGASFVFLGRSFLYAAVVGGEPAVHHAAALLTKEIDRNMALLGIRQLSELKPEHVRRIRN
ncbi:MAG: alpha-hydroxy acid oxidase, partial [Hyphomicrobiaceae bacterium]